LADFKGSIDELEQKIQLVLEENTRLNQAAFDASQETAFYKETSA
jgi:hypothetical protein